MPSATRRSVSACSQLAPLDDASLPLAVAQRVVDDRLLGSESSGTKTAFAVSSAASG